MSAASEPRRSGRWIVVLFAVTLVLMLLFAAAPLISAMVAGYVAQSHGCVLNEGGANPCVINGTDYGETLKTMFVAGWFAFFTIPAAALAFIVWVIVAVVVAVVRGRRRQA